MSEEKPEYKADPTPDGHVIAVSRSCEPKAWQEAKQSAGNAATEAASRIAALESTLMEKDAALGEAKKLLDTQSSDLAALKTTHEAAVTAYKKLAVSSNPLFTGELITGSTIAEVDASIQKVTDLAGKVRSKIEADIKSVSVPAGAPERSGPDTSGLSPREKIKQGLSNK